MAAGQVVMRRFKLNQDRSGWGMDEGIGGGY
jgi:hypothetical protein